MLNQFYKYLANKLISFFNEQELQVGQRFYLQFDEKKQVENFYNTLKEDKDSKIFKYKHEYGTEYITFAVNVKGIKVIVGATINNITPDYLVTLRNQVSEQKNQWKNSALLIICDETLDSIKGGSSNLQKEGMPFHVDSISKNLKGEIEKSKLTKGEKEVVLFYLKNKLQNLVSRISLWDFQEIFTILNKEKIEKEDYPQLGLFYDQNINQYTVPQMRKRLEENRNFFYKVQYIHEYEDAKKQLDKYFDEKGVNILKKEDWKDTEYSFIKKSNEKNNRQDKPLVYYENPNKLTEEKLIYWERPIKETKAGQRKRHIIVFNPNRLEDITIFFEFDDILNKSYIHKKSRNICSVIGKKLKISLKHKGFQTSFYRAIYSHNNQTKSKYEFNITVVECSSESLETVKTIYEVSEKEKKVIINSKGEKLIFGNKDKELEKIYIDNEDKSVNIDESKGYVISLSLDHEESLNFKININESEIPFLVREYTIKSTPVRSQRIWKLKREYEEDFTYENNKLKQGTREYYPCEGFKKYLNFERELIEKECLFGRSTIDGIDKIDIIVSKKLRNAYLDLIKYYKKNNVLPSLAYFNEELTKLCEEYLKEFNNEIESIEENSILYEIRDKKDIFNLGTIKEGTKILLTPLSPLNIAYQLEINYQLGSEEIPSHILDRLHPNNLLPYIYGKEDLLYRPLLQDDAVEWIVYDSVDKVSIGESNIFIASVIEEKLTQFIKHFQYLFIKNGKAPIKINSINIVNDKEVVKGIFNFMKKQIEKKGIYNITPIEITLYQNEKTLSAFDTFFMYDDGEKIEQEFQISLKLDNLDKGDVLRIAQENISYYKRNIEDNFNYAHISFYKMNSKDKSAKDNMQEIETGLSLDGILSTVTSINNRQSYRTGFGVKNILNNYKLIIRTCRNLNELVANLDNDSSNPYRKKVSIVTRTSQCKEKELNNLYNSSYWVTFIEPNVGLEFFKKSNKELLIIHYNDQYTSSDQYDAITVTNKVSQYRSVIKEYLKNKNVNVEDKKLDKAIHTFNSINGEWLLKIISSKGEFDREKISIVSAIKYVLSCLNHDNILWIPISLEEILRIAGNVKLNKSEGIFSAKNLKVKGVHSDDLLFIGLELENNNDLKLYYYPVEVKSGLNQNSTIDKGKNQIENTYSLLKKQLQQKDKSKKKLFKNKFFRNFFIQLLLSNAHKFRVNELGSGNSFHIIDKIKPRLLNDNYEISFNLLPYIGKGAVVSFKKDNFWRRVFLQEDKYVIELTEEDGYTGIVEDIDKLIDKIQKGKTDIRTSDLLSRKYKKEDLPKLINNNENSKEDIKVLLGRTKESCENIYWKCSNKNLENRNLLIFGKHSQEKNYFIQYLLKELFLKGISSIIFDYKNNFKKSKLEYKFKEFMGDKLVQFLVAKDKFPVNPFKRNEKELDEGEYILEDNVDIAERIKSVMKDVYIDLGIEELNCIYEATISGLEKYDNKMDFKRLRFELEKSERKCSKTVLARLNPMIDKNPFDINKEFDWSQFDNNKGKIFIVQLTGFSREMQLIIIQFILRDLLNYKLKNYDKNSLFSVVLEDDGKIDYSKNSLIFKILNSDKNFGLLCLFLSEFLKGKTFKNKICFPPLDYENLNKNECVLLGDTFKVEKDGLKLKKPIIIDFFSMENRM